MIALAFLVIGVVVSVVLWAGLQTTFHRSQALRRRNYRDHELPVASGVVIVLAVVLVQVMYSLIVLTGGTSVASKKSATTNRPMSA